MDDYPVCPYCGHIELDWHDYNLKDNKQESVICNKCDKEYLVQMTIYYYFECEKKEQ